MGQVMFSARAGIQIIAVTAVIFSLLISAPKVGAAGSNWYVGASIPVMYIDDTDTITTGSSAANPTTMPPTPPSTYRGKAVNKYDTGFKLEGVIGYELGSNVRVELELFYSEVDVDKLIYSDVSTTIQGPQPVTFDISEEARPPVSGSAEQIGAMLNLWYDIDLGSKWTPYIGVGVGVIEVDFGDVKYDDNALAQHVANEVAVMQVQGAALAAGQPVPPREFVLMSVPQLPPGYAPSVSTTDTVFAYQAAAGVSYQFRDNLVLRLGYRYQTSDDLKFKGRSNPFGNTVETKTDFDVQFIEIGFRYHF